MIYRFGDCEVDTKLLELRRGGTVRPIDPLGFDLLRYLIENRDRVLTRDELLDTLWPGKVVTDSALSSRLKSVRGAVGDTGASQEIIKTVHGRGYRFIAALEEAPEAPAVRAMPAGLDVHAPQPAAVGRDTELGKLGRWLDRALEGERSIVLISGEAGVGKTTLTRAFLAAAQRERGVSVLQGQCVNQRGVSEAYLPLLEALGRAGHRDPSITEMLSRHAPAWLAQLPSLEKGAADSAPVLSVTTGRMLRELSEVLDHLAQRTNLVLVLEDLHWSDPSTIGWLEYYVRRTDKARLLLIATLRPEGPFQSACRELVIRGYAHGLELDSIDEAYVSDYLMHRLDHRPTPELAALTFRRTGGFPLFIDTLVDHWLEKGLIRRADGEWSACDEDGALLAGVPDSLSDLIDQQLESLKEDDQQLLQTAALAGSPFASAAIAYALGRADEEVEALYHRLARQGRIVRNMGEEHWPDGTVTATFEFRHELYREALYGCVSAARRARLHLALGERLEKAYGDDPGPHAGEIADHFARAREADRALRYFYPAALVAYNRSASRETIALVDRALDLMATREESPERQDLERKLQLLRASAFISLEGWASRQVEQSFTRARELSESLGLKENLSEVYGIAAMHELRGRFAESQAVIESLLELSPELSLEAHELLACSLFHQGRFDQSMKSAERGYEEYDPEEISAVLARYGENPGVCCHSWAALDLWFLGYPKSSMQHSNQALELAQGHAYSLSSALTYRTFLHQFRNELKETVAWSAKTREVAGKQGFDFRVAQTMMLGAWAAGRQAETEAEQRAALERIDLALSQHRSMGAEMDLPYYLTLKADVLAHMGLIDEALEVQAEAFAANPKGRAFFYEAEMHRLNALLLLKRDPAQKELAEESLARSLDVARRQGARMLELRTCLTRCQLTNGSDAARIGELKHVLGRLAEGDGTAECQAARDYVSGPPP